MIDSADFNIYNVLPAERLLWGSDLAFLLSPTIAKVGAVASPPFAKCGIFETSIDVSHSMDIRP